MDIELDPFICVGLIDMYCKCGLVEDARMICDLMPEKDLIALNALVCGLSQNRKDIEALKLFTEMYKEGKGFNETTLLAVLNSTASFQAVDVCKQVHTLSVKYGFLSDIYVINSLIDSYGKCSQVEDAARITRGSSNIMVNSEYFPLTLIRPPSIHSFAPVTTQYPGGSSGPLTISFVSTKCDIFGALVGRGGPAACHHREPKPQEEDFFYANNPDLKPGLCDYGSRIINPCSLILNWSSAHVREYAPFYRLKVASFLRLVIWLITKIIR
ncbi:hypothetical protein RJ639_024113 [Escallonia herrerae]|uniref:Pentatricopeptide repeat-containing protein n=1 Tax=Escallonia herrerae TaxID=1293975 RepID=A0AA89ACK0_9ASTE|nr:hypothetical protein RJ639_024113 [Escallonia herrerae]